MRPVYAMREDAKKAGWFSRRHQTTVEHNTARTAWQERQQRKLSRVAAGIEVLAERTAKERLMLLDSRLGPGQGAARERARLMVA